MAEREATGKPGRGLLYERVADRLRRDIVAGFYPRGTFLPSEADLCARFEVSRGTLRRALADLARLGLVRSQPGVGHRVAGRLASSEEGENNLVAVLAPYVEGGPYFAEMVGGLERSLAEAGLALIVCSTDRRSSMTSEEVLAAQVDRILHMRPRAVVLSTEPHQSDREHMRAFSRADIPVFQVGRQPRGLISGFVGTDERLGSLIVTDWLIRWSGGATMVVTGEVTTGFEQRLEGYNMALASHGLQPSDAGRIRLTDDSEEVVPADKLPQLAQGERIGLFCVSSVDLPATSQLIQQAGLNIGEQVAVGCVHCPPWRAPSISMPHIAARWSAADLGESAGALVVGGLANGDAAVSQQRLVVPRLAVDPAYGAPADVSGADLANLRR